jgi:hypothetical protein
MSARRRLGEVLVQLRALTPGDVERVLAALRRRQPRCKFGQMARDMGLLGEEHILAALAVQMQLLPGIERMSLEQVLGALQSNEAAAV